MAKNITDLKLADWQKYIEDFKSSGESLKAKTNAPVAMRIDGTPLSVMRFYGGGTYNGARYVTFEDRSVKGSFTCEYATIAVRWDFHLWVIAQIRKESRKAKEADNA